MRALTPLVPLVFVASSSLLACGSSAAPSAVGGTQPGTEGDTPVISTDETWENGKVLDTPTVIDANTTVTIAAGATIQAVSGIQITVKGTLKSAGGAQATLIGTSPTTRWSGILVSSGGTVSLDHVDITNADGGINAGNGAVAVTYSNGTITAAKAPFVTDTSGKITTSHAFVKGSIGASHIKGELDASYLDYDANGQDGITAESDTAVIHVADSELHGNGGSSDMIVSYLGAQSINVEYTEIKNVHCAFHIERVTNLSVSHVTATANQYGFMMYGSLNTGTRTVDAMNIEGQLSWGIAEEDGDINGPTSFTNSYFANNAFGDVRLQTSSKISVTNDATAAIADAKPR